ncbi:MAG: hypothetical protein K8R21_04260 [Leptospira sp.]|nr:hypothetical protein [Leptospira sp.]
MQKAPYRTLNSGIIAWIILPNILLCISLGFISTLVIKNSYLEIKAVEFEDIFFSLEKLVILSAYFAGFAIRRLIPSGHVRVMESSICILLGTEIAWSLGNSSNVLMIDYIFNKDITISFIIMNFFALGALVSTLRNFRLWSFLSGGIAYLIYSYSIGELQLNVKDYLIPFLGLLIAEFLVHGFFSQFKTFTESRRKINMDYLMNEFFYTGCIFMVLHLVLFASFPDGNLDLLISGIIFGLLMFSIFLYYGFFREKIKLRFRFGEILIFINLILTFNHARFDNFIFFLFLIDSILITYYRPDIISPIILGLSCFARATIGLSFLFVQSLFFGDWFSYFILILSILLIISPIFLNRKISHFSRITFLVISLAFSIYFYSPAVADLRKIQYRSVESKTFPFLFSDINFNDKDFIYYKSDLPFNEPGRLPDREVIAGKTVVLGVFENQEIFISYIKKLYREKIDFVIIQNQADQLLPTGHNLKISEYPLFRLYYPDFRNTIPGKIPREELKNSWKTDYVYSRISSAKSIDQIMENLDAIRKYSGGEIAETARNFQSVIYSSYGKYAVFQYEKKDFLSSLAMIRIAMQFSKPDPVLQEMAYNSILQITPESEHISIMNELAGNPKYKEQILKRLYPILYAERNYIEALAKIDDLIGFYKSTAPQSHLNVLLITKAKIYLAMKDTFKADEIIRKESYANPDSVAWKKLEDDLKVLKDSTRNRWLLETEMKKGVINAE